ncbi:hypothetical protein AURDEDRAFT_159175 [Auricularia subglabra TFB-10046 SS5]|nr:hypothetical protein AURDEDRAFT_159175 [Auricularia subglabra TFB-10046 SS5]
MRSNTIEDAAAHEATFPSSQFLSAHPHDASSQAHIADELELPAAPQPAMNMALFNVMCAEFLSIPDIARALAKSDYDPDSAGPAAGTDDNDEGSTATTPALAAFTPGSPGTTAPSSVHTPECPGGHGSADEDAIVRARPELYERSLELQLRTPMDMMDCIPSQGYASAPSSCNNGDASRMALSGGGRRKRARESGGSAQRMVRRKFENDPARQPQSADGLGGDGSQSNSIPARAPLDCYADATPKLSAASWNAGPERSSSPSPAAAVSRPPADAHHYVPTDGPPADAQPAPPRTRGRKNKHQKKQAGEQETVDAMPIRGASGGNPAPGRGSTSSPVSVDPSAPTGAHEDVPADALPFQASDDEEVEPASRRTRGRKKQKKKQGRKRVSSAIKAGLGPGAQAEKKYKSRPGKAIESFTRGNEWRLPAIRAALVVLYQPTSAPLPEPHPVDVTDAVLVDLHDEILRQPDEARSGAGEWEDCEECLDVYGVHERFPAGRQGQHTRDCHNLRACVLCGCPVTRGDVGQFRRHRKANCPLWRVLLHTGRHLEWLDAHGMIDEGHKQFFADGVGKRAPTRQQRVKELEGTQDMKDVRKAIRNGVLFNRMVAKDVEDDLREAEKQAQELAASGA